MATRNLSKIKRERLIEKIRELKETADEETVAILNEVESELNKKKYGLVWEEHSEEVEDAMLTQIPVFTEVAEHEITSDPDGDYNFLLEGDNLHSLHLLEKTHRGRIDVIYIDPPYNTGKNSDEPSSKFVYDDKIVDETDSYIHSKWLSFMKVRLKIARTLIKPDGIIFISIGKEEIATLRLLCDEIFGEQNLLGQVVRRTKTTSFRGNYFALRLDYILCYSTGVLAPSRFMDVVDATKYTKTETEGIFAGEKYKDDTAFYLSTLETRPNQRYFIECPDGELVVPPGTTIPNKAVDGEKCVPDNRDGVWRWERDQYLSKKHYLSFKQTSRSPLINSNGEKAHWNVYTKSYYCEKKDDGNIPTELLLDFINRNGSEELKNLGLDFLFPKPSELIKYLIYITNKKNNITILDFFAGSGTTGQAVLELNAKDKGHRKFILCTNNENKICENVTYPRVKTVITGERIDGSKYSDGIPANLKYYKTEFVPKTNDGSVPYALLEHVKELIQLELHCKIDNKTICIAFNEDELDSILAKNAETCKKLFLSSDVLLSGKQIQQIEKHDIEVIDILEYYFSEELREVDEV